MRINLDYKSIAIIAVYAGIISYLVHSHTWEFESNSSSLTWQQPSDITLANIASHPMNIEFDKVEKALSDIRHNEAGEVVLNSTAIDTLRSTVKQLPDSYSQEDLDRIKFLINRMHPQYSHNQLADIVFKYQNYLNEASQQAFRKNRPQSLDGAKDAFKTDLELKEQHLGKELTQALFASRHTMTRFVLENKTVLNNNELNQSQKVQQLVELSQTLRH